MRKNKKAERDLQKLMAMLADKGFEQEKIVKAAEVAPTGREAISRQGEAVLMFLEAPAKFTTKECKRCKEPFGTNYRAVAYCSDNCRAKAVFEITGMNWDWRKPEEERWGGEPPMVIDPKSFKKLNQFVDALQSRTQRQTEFRQETVEVPPEQLLLPPFVPTETHHNEGAKTPSTLQETRFPSVLLDTPSEDFAFDFE